MASENTGEPSRKKLHSPINFSSCLKCEKATEDELTKPSEETYNKFLEKIYLRASYGNTDFVKLKERIGHLSAADLYKNKAVLAQKMLCQHH